MNIVTSLTPSEDRRSGVIGVERCGVTNSRNEESVNKPFHSAWLAAGGLMSFRSWIHLAAF